MLVRLLPLDRCTPSQTLSPKHPWGYYCGFSSAQGEMSELKGSLEAICSCIPQQSFMKQVFIKCQVLGTELNKTVAHSSSNHSK